VTGAGSGLGRALARRLASDGDTIILLGRTRATLDAVAAELGHSAIRSCGCSKRDSVRTAFATNRGASPEVDLLINNAAVYRPFFVKDRPTHRSPRR